jgi:hypothetical protein
MFSDHKDEYELKIKLIKKQNLNEMIERMKDQVNIFFD